MLGAATIVCASAAWIGHGVTTIRPATIGDFFRVISRPGSDGNPSWEFVTLDQHVFWSSQTDLWFEVCVDSKAPLWGLLRPMSRREVAYVMGRRHLDGAPHIAVLDSDEFKSVRDAFAIWVEAQREEAVRSGMSLSRSRRDCDPLWFRSFPQVVREAVIVPGGSGRPLPAPNFREGREFVSWRSIAVNCVMVFDSLGALLFGGALFRGGAHALTWNDRAFHGRCPACGYDRAGLPVDNRCPECEQAMRA